MICERYLARNESTTDTYNQIINMINKSCPTGLRPAWLLGQLSSCYFVLIPGIICASIFALCILLVLVNICSFFVLVLVNICLVFALYCIFVSVIFA